MTMDKQYKEPSRQGPLEPQRGERYALWFLDDESQVRGQTRFDKLEELLDAYPEAEAADSWAELDTEEAEWQRSLECHDWLVHWLWRTQDSEARRTRGGG